jgi:hypothetical protein
MSTAASARSVKAEERARRTYSTATPDRRVIPPAAIRLAFWEYPAISPGPE